MFLGLIRSAMLTCQKEQPCHRKPRPSVFFLIKHVTIHHAITKGGGIGSQNRVNKCPFQLFFGGTDFIMFIEHLKVASESPIWSMHTYITVSGRLLSESNVSGLDGGSVLLTCSLQSAIVMIKE